MMEKVGRRMTRESTHRRTHRSALLGSGVCRADSAHDSLHPYLSEGGFMLPQQPQPQQVSPSLASRIFGMTFFKAQPILNEDPLP